MNKTLGCIGCGNMGSAILRGLAKRDDLNLMGYNPSPAKTEALAADIDRFVIARSAREVAQRSDYIILGVKPYLIGDVLAEIAGDLTPDKVVISVAAGVSVAALQKGADARCAVVRCMPNTPAMVGEGIFAMCYEDAQLPESQQDAISDLFGTIGTVMVLPETKFGAFTATAGCGPAYVFHFMEAVIEAAVTVGFTRKDAADMVIQLFKGSVKLAEESGQHISVLRESVCSPGGVTIAAVNHLDRTAVRGNIIDAILTARERDREMSK